MQQLFGGEGRLAWLEVGRGCYLDTPRSPAEPHFEWFTGWVGTPLPGKDIYVF